jgi:hypothetical protein
MKHRARCPCVAQPCDAAQGSKVNAYLIANCTRQVIAERAEGAENDWAEVSPV